MISALFAVVRQSFCRFCLDDSDRLRTGQLRGLQHKLLGLKKTPSEKFVFNESRTFTWGGFAILFLLLSTATPLTLAWFDLTLATLLLHNSAGALFRSDTLWSLFPWGCLNPNRFTLVAMPSFLGGINLGVERAVGAMLVVSGSVSLFPFPFLSMMSVLARRRAAFELDAIDGAVVGRRLKPNDVETPFVWRDCFLDKSLSSSPGLYKTKRIRLINAGHRSSTIFEERNRKLVLSRF